MAGDPGLSLSDKKNLAGIRPKLDSSRKSASGQACNSPPMQVLWARVSSLAVPRPFGKRAAEDPQTLWLGGDATGSPGCGFHTFVGEIHGDSASRPSGLSPSAGRTFASRSRRYQLQSKRSVA